MGVAARNSHLSYIQFCCIMLHFTSCGKTLTFVPTKNFGKFSPSFWWQKIPGTGSPKVERNFAPCRKSHVILASLRLGFVRWVCVGAVEILHLISRWWQLKDFGIFTPTYLGEMDEIWRCASFSNGLNQATKLISYHMTILCMLHNGI